MEKKLKIQKISKEKIEKIKKAWFQLFVGPRNYKRLEKGLLIKQSYKRD